MTPGMGFNHAGGILCDALNLEAAFLGILKGAVRAAPRIDDMADGIGAFLHHETVAPENRLFERNRLQIGVQNFIKSIGIVAAEGKIGDYQKGLNGGIPLFQPADNISALPVKVTHAAVEKDADAFKNQLFSSIDDLRRQIAAIQIPVADKTAGLYNAIIHSVSPPVPVYNCAEAY